MLTVELVKGTLPYTFKENFAKTYIIVDASKIFIETLKRVGDIVINIVHLQA